MKQVKKTISSTIAALLATQVVHAGSFSLYTEGTGYVIGNYAAGVAAEAFDASTGWYNPAGLALLDNEQVVLGGVGVFPSTKLSGISTFDTPAFSTTYVETFHEINGAHNAFVPSFHYALPWNDCTSFGLSIVSPFGLMTDWGTTSAVRYAGTKSKFFTVDIAPEIGTRVTQNVAIGAGLDLQFARVTFNNVLGAPTLLIISEEPPTTWDSRLRNKGQSFGAGFHAGFMLLSDDEHSRLGVNYQSQVHHRFHGQSQLSGRLASDTLADPYALFISDELTSDSINLPAILTISAYHDVNELFAILGSIVYTGWESLSSIGLNQVAGFSTATLAPALLNFEAPLEYRNTWRVAGGVNYQVTPQWMLRAGGGYDQTPTNNIDRDVRIPDCSRWAVSLGAHFQAGENIGFDAGYTHMFQASASRINNTIPLEENNFTVNASTKNSVDLLGLQFTWTMDDAEPAMMK